MNKIKRIIEASVTVKQAILQDDQLQQRIEDAINIIVSAFESGNKVWFCGNGGSAADAQHLAAEFSGRFYIDRKALPS
jgi:D-sedoheptulose 7-phosphate isomerase